MKKLKIIFGVLMLTAFYAPIVCAFDQPILKHEVKTSQDVFNNNSVDLFFDPLSGKNYTTQADESLIKDYTLGEGTVTDPTKLETRGEYQIRNIVFVLKGYAYKILIPFTMILGVYAGLHLVFARGKEETYKEKKEQILGFFYAFATLLLGVVLVDKVFFGVNGELLAPNQNNDTVIKFAEQGYTQMEGVFNYVLTFAVVVAVGIVIYSAIRLIISTEPEEALKKFKQQVQYVVIGMVILVSGKTIVDLFTGNHSELSQMVTTADHSLKVPQVSGTIAFLTQWINFILGVIGVVAVIAIIYGGIRLIASMGTDDKAKEEATTIIKGAIIGLIVAFSSWTIMYYFIAPKGTSDVHYVRPSDRK